MTISLINVYQQSWNIEQFSFNLLPPAGIMETTINISIPSQPIQQDQLILRRQIETMAGEVDQLQVDLLDIISIRVESSINSWLCIEIDIAAFAHLVGDSFKYLTFSIYLTDNSHGWLVSHKVIG